MEELVYFATFHGQGHPRAAELAERLVGMFPPAWGLNRVMSSSGGSEANETNFKVARLYHPMLGEEHKKTIGALAQGLLEVIPPERFDAEQADGIEVQLQFALSGADAFAGNRLVIEGDLNAAARLMTLGIL